MRGKKRPAQEREPDEGRRLREEKRMAAKVEVVTLDDLYRKTKAKPVIFYKPLTEKEVCFYASYDCRLKRSGKSDYRFVLFEQTHYRFLRIANTLGFQVWKSPSISSAASPLVSSISGVAPIP